MSVARICEASLTDRQQAASVRPVTDGPAELNRKLELRRRVVENTGEVWETVASLSKADAGQRGWQRVVMAGEVTARRSSEKPLRWSTSASFAEVGLSSDTPAGSSPVAARTPTPLKKKRPSLTPSTSGQSLLGAPRSDDGGPSAPCAVEPERTPCIAEGGSRGPEGYPLHEVARLRQLLVDSERRCRVLAEHSDGFWEEEVKMATTTTTSIIIMARGADCLAGYGGGCRAPDSSPRRSSAVSLRCPVMSASTANRRTPGDFLREVRGCGVRVRLNNGTDYTGRLLALDGFMNLAMDDATEFPDGVNSGSEGRRYGQAVIRGNNVLYISMVERRQDEAAEAATEESQHAAEVRLPTQSKADSSPAADHSRPPLKEGVGSTAYRELKRKLDALFEALERKPCPAWERQTTVLLGIGPEAAKQSRIARRARLRSLATQRLIDIQANGGELGDGAQNEHHGRKLSEDTLYNFM
ncbi:U4/U6-U5 snRNP complex subunit lsm6 [Perkinsus olseni]|uniref:U4/U6-U5 snRNP complex subunit lsm6 n=1 Tax=Perkinsus olseni TaxID=32597 RepID=A0A7J6Q2L8_PEROL|nr:U4/U6-U5 snRNP complex subunit lsm6 [Perkinsus olseni]